LSRKKKPRNANGRSSICFSDRDNSWHGYVMVGVKDNGRPDRRHVRGKTKTAVTTKVRKLERERDEDKVRKPGQTWTVKQWLIYWLETIIAPPVITENAFIAYEVAARVHLIPGIGAHKLDKLEPEHLKLLYRKMTRAGAKPGRVHQVHRTIRAALNEAMRRKKITENPALLARAPKVEENEVEPYSVAQVKSLPWDGPTPRWPLVTSTSSRPSGETWPPASADCSGSQPRQPGRVTMTAPRGTPHCPRNKQMPPQMQPAAQTPVTHKGGDRRLPCLMAVAVGFEPTEGVNPHALSRRAPSAARTRYRG
jgi:Phage integrase, N-terminal SAM-like domain